MCIRDSSIDSPPFHYEKGGGQSRSSRASDGSQPPIRNKGGRTELRAGDDGNRDWEGSYGSKHDEYHYDGYDYPT
eukprot:92670-Karenia_brevis.AAC.1